MLRWQMMRRTGPKKAETLEKFIKKIAEEQKAREIASPPELVEKMRKLGFKGETAELQAKLIIKRAGSVEKAKEIAELLVKQL